MFQVCYSYRPLLSLHLIIKCDLNRQLERSTCVSQFVMLNSISSSRAPSIYCKFTLIDTYINYTSILSIFNIIICWKKMSYLFMLLSKKIFRMLEFKRFVVSIKSINDKYKRITDYIEYIDWIVESFILSTHIRFTQYGAYNSYIIKWKVI